MKHKTKLFLGLFLSLLLISTLTPASDANAQMFSSYASSLSIQNLSNTEAIVSFTYYYGGTGSNAGDVASTATETLGAHDVMEVVAMPSSPFTGSVVISSSQPIGSVSTLNGNNKGRGAYVGSTSGSTSVVLPFMMHEWGTGGWNTYFSVQNVGAGNATVNIDYNSCASAVDDTVIIEPYSMALVNQAIEPCMVGKVMTSAILTSDQPIVVVVSQESTRVNSALVSNGYSSGSTNPVIPLVNSNNPPTPIGTGWRTAISMFNLDPTLNTVVTLKYVRKDGFECQETRTIRANSATEFGGNAFILGAPELTCPVGEYFVGAAYVVENSAGVDLVATVNQDRGTLASSYSSFNMDEGTPIVAFPRFVNQYGGFEDWDSTFTIMNVGSTNTYVKCVYTNATYESVLGLLEPYGVDEDLPRYGLPQNYSGAGVCTAYTDSTYSTIDAAARIVGVVNTRGHGDNNDLMMTYEAINVEYSPE